ncbi:MAG: hypothetical protein JWR52_3898 [Marmoricola sp.]|nr:hypothetical protein [Marmoricola sp.]
MSTRTKTDAQLIAAYRRGAARRRAKSALNNLPGTVDEAVTDIAGIATVKKAQGAVSVSELGGPTEVFGRSKISIPEFKRSVRKK